MVVTEESVRQALKTVIDPELGINIIDLGLVYEVKIKNPSISAGRQKSNLKIHVLMTLTTQGCPLGGWFLEHVKEAVVSVVGVEEEQVEVEITFDPPWTMELMDLEAKAELGFD
jgi:metal-sulfur cluster biosynthetic enzyme